MLKRVAIYVFVALGLVFLAGLPGLGQEKALTATGQNLIPNSSFEDVNQDGRPSGFWFGVYQGDAQISVDNTVARTGKNSVRITGNGDDRGMFGIRLQITGGKSYRFSIWYRTTDTMVPGKALGRLMAYKTTGSTEGDKVPWKLDWIIDPYEGEYQISGNNLHVLAWQEAVNDWKCLTVAFKLPQNVIAIQVEGFNWLGNGTVWFDDVSLVELEETVASLTVG